jgi:predicted RNA binding protein YcfA (HicA-like mRNA interferase family)
MKCSQLYRILAKDGWYPVSQKGSHVKTCPSGRRVRHDSKKGVIIFPNHGSQEMGKGLEKKILKDAGIKI